jgi:hypothetical protein
MQFSNTRPRAGARMRWHRGRRIVAVLDGMATIFRVWSPTSTLSRGRHLLLAPPRGRCRLLGGWSWKGWGLCLPSYYSRLSFPAYGSCFPSFFLGLIPNFQYIIVVLWCATNLSLPWPLWYHQIITTCACEYCYTGFWIWCIRTNVKMSKHMILISPNKLCFAHFPISVLLQLIVNSLICANKLMALHSAAMETTRTVFLILCTEPRIVNNKTLSYVLSLMIFCQQQNTELCPLSEAMMNFLANIPLCLLSIEIHWRL